MSAAGLSVATWNVNSIRVRQEHVIAWLAANRPDVVCFQETKVQDEDFPAGELEEQSGYSFLASGQKAYNGVALALAPHHEASDVVLAQPPFCAGQARLIEATVAGVRVLSVYVPNGNPPGGDKYRYKLAFLEGFAKLLATRREQHQLVVVGGDYNVAPHDSDVYDIDDWGRDQICVTQAERAAYFALLERGYVDAFAALGCAPAYSWWDFRTRAFDGDQGLRIDHVLVSAAAAVRSHRVDRDERARPRPSDHAPVVVELALPA